MKVRNVVFLLAIFFSQLSFAQNGVPSDEEIVKWKNATINIECREWGTTYAKQIYDAQNRGLITKERAANLVDSLWNSPVKVTGTAIYLKYHDKPYLLTARHMLEDPSTEKKNQLYIGISIVLDSTLIKEVSIIRNRDGSFSSTGFSPQLNTITESDSSKWHFAFSKVEDIAVMRLYGGMVDSFVVDYLKTHGYQPLDISDIDTTGKVSKNRNIWCIGFPGESYVGGLDLPSVVEYWHSSRVTLPFISYGTISKFEKNSPVFEGSIFVYHGMSGGPVISNGKLIGIVARGEFERRKVGSQKLNTYILNHSVFVKLTTVMDLLRKIEVPVP